MKKLLFILIALCATLPAMAQIAVENFEGGENEFLFNGRTMLIKTSVGYVSNVSIPEELTNDYYTIGVRQPSFSIVAERSFQIFNLPKSFYFAYNFSFSYFRQSITLHNKQLIRLYGLEDNTSSASVLYPGVGVSLHKSFSDKLESYINVGWNYLFYTSAESGFEAIPSEADRSQVSALLGVRYGLTNLFSLFAEGGYDVQYLKVGLALSF